MIKPPGQTKFKLVRLKEPIIDKATGMKYEFICPELQDKKCINCQNGWIHVAYGKKDGLWQVFTFPCECLFPDTGLKYFQTDEERRYINRVPDYEAESAELPGYVFIHPKHNSEFGGLGNRLAQIREKLEIEQNEEEPPF